MIKDAKRPAQPEEASLRLRTPACMAMHRRGRFSASANQQDVCLSPAQIAENAKRTSVDGEAPIGTLQSGHPFLAAASAQPISPTEPRHLSSRFIRFHPIFPHSE